MMIKLKKVKISPGTQQSRDLYVKFHSDATKETAQGPTRLSRSI
jgi:hypothetical protein